MGRDDDRPALLYRFMKHAFIPVGVRLMITADIRGLGDVPASGPLILASNHVDNFDAGAIGWRAPRYLRFLARPEGFSHWHLRLFWRLGGVLPASGEGLAAAIAILRRGGAIAIYPEGTISPALVPARSGLGVLAMRGRAAVVPVAVWGTEHVHFPASILRRATVHVRYGEPIDAGSWPKGRDRAQELTDLVMARIAAMLPEEYRGAYAGAVHGSDVRAAAGG